MVLRGVSLIDNLVSRGAVVFVAKSILETYQVQTLWCVVDVNDIIEPSVVWYGGGCRLCRFLNDGDIPHQLEGLYRIARRGVCTIWVALWFLLQRVLKDGAPITQTSRRNFIVSLHYF